MCCDLREIKTPLHLLMGDLFGDNDAEGQWCLLKGWFLGINTVNNSLRIFRPQINKKTVLISIHGSASGHTHRFYYESKINLKDHLSQTCGFITSKKNRHHSLHACTQCSPTLCLVLKITNCLPKNKQKKFNQDSSNNDPHFPPCRRYTCTIQ